MTYKLSTIIALSMSAMSLTACLGSGHQYAGVEPTKRNQVQHARLAQPIPVDIENGELSANSKAQIQSFLYISEARYGDRLALDLGDDIEAGDTRYLAVARYMTSLGVRLSDTPIVGGAAPAPGMAVLIIDRYTVTPPNCHTAGSTGRQLPITMTSSAFGCASRSNLGVMVANPRDLIIGADFDGPSSEPAAAAAGAYRKGEAPPGPALTSPISNSTSGN